MEIEHKITLLAILKKRGDESINDTLKMLVNTKSFTLKEGKQILKDLKREGYLTDEGLTFIGTAKAKEAEAEFKI
ncbi:MAG: hypothetical protein ACQESH_01895 [Campylobacterota bacterium]